MGILNVTPDSFSDGGLFAERGGAVAQALSMEAEGADILDIGGESTRPGHIPVPADVEAGRVVPAIEALAPRLGIPISVDTSKAAVARAALGAGARIVNDVWGLQRDPAMASVVADAQAGLVLMHNREAADPSLDILDELRRFFDRSLDLARRAGVVTDRVVLDPGIGFGKTPDQQLETLRRLPELKAMGFPVLVGVSRKSILGRIADRASAPGERLGPSVAAAVAAATLGADILRVHDVAPHREALRVVDAILGRAA